MAFLATSKERGFAKRGTGLTIDTSVVAAYDESLASALSSARLTPSPYCSPTIQTDINMKKAVGEFGPPQHPGAENCFAPRRPEWPRQPSGVANGGGLWPLKSIWGAPGPACAQGPAYVPPGSTSSTSDDGDGSSSLLSSCFTSQLPHGGSFSNGTDYSYPREPLLPARQLAVPLDSRRVYQLPPLWPVRVDGGRDERERQPVVGQHVFGTQQLQAALPPVPPPVRPPVPPPAVAPTKPLAQSQSTGFLPMMAVSQPEQRRNSVEAMQQQAGAASSKFSARYHGMHTDSNASADHLTAAQNCALWLTNLPGDISYGELLGSIRNVGRIWCSYINSPDNVKHHTAAAKVVFFTPEAAQKLLSESWTQTMVIRNHRVKVSHNRIKYGANAVTGKTSRVLIVTGRADFVNADNLRAWFRERFVFQEDRVIELIKAAGRAVYEFRFGSYRCQAQMGKMALEKDRPAGLEKVEFGDDPCEVGETMASYGIAAERIQGRGL